MWRKITWGWCLRVTKQVQSLNRYKKNDINIKEVRNALERHGLCSAGTVCSVGLESGDWPSHWTIPCCCLQNLLDAFMIQTSVYWTNWSKVCVCVYLLCEEQEKKIQLVNKNLLFLIPPLQPRSPPEWMHFHCNGGHIVRLMGCKADIKPTLLCPQGAAGVSVHQIFPSNLFLPSSLHGTYAHPCCWWGKRA